MKVFCIIPAYNEGKNIQKVIQEVKPLVDKVVIVDDGSSDDTYEISRKEGVIILRHVVNRGQGAALETGNEYARKNRASIVVHFDADGQFLAKEIGDMVEPLIKKEVDVSFGSRFLGKESEIPWAKRKIIFPLARLVNYIFFRVRLTDPQSGFRAMNRKALDQVRIEQDGMAHCSEIMSKVFAQKLKVKEVPITVVYHDYGQRFGGGLKIIKDLIIAKLNN